jgi:hypothetical protein
MSMSKTWSGWVQPLGKVFTSSCEIAHFQAFGAPVGSARIDEHAWVLQSRT